HRTHRNERAETHHLPLSPVENSGTERPTLADETYIPASRDVRSESSVKSGQRIHNSQAIGPDQAHTAALHSLQDLPLQCSAWLSVFLEARRDDNYAANLGFHTLTNNVGHSFRRGYNHGEVNRFRNVRDGVVGFNSQHTRTLVADRIDRATERATDQTPKNSPANTGRTFAGADDRNRVGLENRIEGMPLSPENVMRSFERWLCLAGTRGRFRAAHTPAVYPAALAGCQ